MNKLEKTIQEKYDIGFPIFEKLFNLNSSDLKKLLTKICGNLIPNEYILGEGSVRKEILNDIPDIIEIRFYDWLSISAFGIYYIPEDGEGRRIVEFNEFFNIP